MSAAAIYQIIGKGSLDKMQVRHYYNSRLVKANYFVVVLVS